MKKIIWITTMLIAWSNLHAQDFTPLLEKAWLNSDLIKSKQKELEASGFALKEASALYGPNVKFNTTYTLAAGGRSIQFPVGDLLNPVYGTLNQLTSTNNFPQLENQEITFLPNNFYDAKFRVEQAIYHPEIALNKELKSLESDLIQLDESQVKRTIARDVMQAYFQLKQAETFLSVLGSSQNLLQEAERTTASMVTNGIALPSSRIRIEAQKQALEQQMIEARNGILNARLYLAQLLGTEDIDSVMLPELPEISLLEYGQREELLKFDKAGQMLALASKKEEIFYKPRLSAALDAGSQAFNFGWSPYVLLGINLEINLYDHKRHQYRNDQAKAKAMANDAMKQYVSEQFDLTKVIAQNNLTSALRQAATFDTRIQSAERNYKEVNIKYKEGISGYLELLDAENLLTTTRLQYTLSRFNAWSKWAELLYEQAQINLQTNN